MSALEQALDLAQRLSPTDQAQLVEILTARLQSSESLIRDAELARSDFDAGRFEIASPDEIMRQIEQ